MVGVLQGKDERFVWKGRSYSSLDSLRSASSIAAHSIFADPLLAEDGFRLTAESPGINSGHPTEPVEDGRKDLDGEIRLQGPRIDIGPDEIPES